MIVVNLTPRPVNVQPDDKLFFAIHMPSGHVARIDSVSDVVDHIDGVPVHKTAFGNIVGLPAPEAGIVYLTSTMVAQAAARTGRTDVVSPDTGATAIRDEKGQVVAVRAFQRF